MLGAHRRIRSRNQAYACQLMRATRCRALMTSLLEPRVQCIKTVIALPCRVQANSRPEICSFVKSCAAQVWQQQQRSTASASRSSPACAPWILHSHLIPAFPPQHRSAWQGCHHRRCTGQEQSRSAQKQGTQEGALPRVPLNATPMRTAMSSFAVLLLGDKDQGLPCFISHTANEGQGGSLPLCPGTRQ